MTAITPDRAYLIGVLIGGGTYVNNSLSIEFPYSKWGSVLDNPERAGSIAEDLINYLSPLFEQYYDLRISYKTLKSKWIVDLRGDYTLLKNDLKKMDIPLDGSLRKEFHVTGIIPLLTDDYSKRRFVAGLADTIGSVAKSHRRFTDEIQIVSFELSTFNFKGVQAFCQLLHSLKCYPDQVLWNHPSMHASHDRYYTSWKKGVKVRVTLDHYLSRESFNFKSKKVAAKDNLKQQEKKHFTPPCSSRDCSFKLTCVHEQIGSRQLPEPFRGHIFCHHKQICAAAGCPYAPYEELDKQMPTIADYITPFTVKTRGTTSEIKELVRTDKLLSKINFESIKLKFSTILSRCDSNPLLFNKGMVGYKSNLILEGIHFLICGAEGNLSCTRPKGNQKDCFEKMWKKDPNHEFEFLIPEYYSVLIVKDGDYAVMIGCVDPHLSRKLLVRNPENKYLVAMKEPKSEDLTHV